MDPPSVQLVFHPVSGTPGQPSTVCADAVYRVLDSAPASEIRLVSPYLGYGVVKQLVGKRGFRLVTDLDACFERVEDDGLVDFLADKREYVRHLPDVHAKVICTDGAVLLGSANFTRSGLANCDEMGCVVFDRPLVDQVLEWFEKLWNVGQEIQPAVIADIRKHVSRQRNAATKPHIIEPHVARSARAMQRSLGWMGILETPDSPVAITANPDEYNRASDTVAERNELVAHVRKLTRSRAEADRVLALLARALSIADLPVDDDRLHLNFGKEAICVVVNQRYVAWCSHERRIEQFGFILDDSELSGPMQQQIEGAWAGSFKRRGQNDLPAFHVPLDRINDLPETLFQSWEKAIRMEVGRTRKDGNFYTSSYRKHKRPFLYHALTSENYRYEIARRAFPSFWWFGVNNRSGGHVRTGQIRPLLDGRDSHFVWPVGHSKPKSLYREMGAGDCVLIWTGHGDDPDWGLLGTAVLQSVATDYVVLGESDRFPATITPYPRKQPQTTPAFEFLRTTLGEEFRPLGDVMRAVLGSQRKPPVTVAGLSAESFEAIVSYASSTQ